VTLTPIGSLQTQIKSATCSFFTVGGHHEEATARMLMERGAKCQHLHLPHYKVSGIHSGKIEEGLKTMEVSKDTNLVIQVFDSVIYMVRTEEGSLIPPCK
jgi:hypothetical protein